MSDRIEPALTPDGHWYSLYQCPPDEWRENGAHGQQSDTCVGDTPARCAYLVAINNAALPDDDPRKITRHTTVHLRALRVFIQSGMMPSLDARADLEDVLAAHIDALESYLPPE